MFLHQSLIEIQTPTKGHLPRHGTAPKCSSHLSSHYTCEQEIRGGRNQTEASRSDVECLVFLWRTKKSREVHALSIMHRPYTGLKKSALFKRRKAICTGLKHPNLSQSLVRQNARRHQLRHITHSICLCKHNESPEHRLNHSANHSSCVR